MRGRGRESHQLVVSERMRGRRVRACFSRMLLHIAAQPRVEAARHFSRFCNLDDWLGRNAAQANTDSFARQHTTSLLSFSGSSKRDDAWTVEKATASADLISW